MKSLLYLQAWLYMELRKFMKVHSLEIEDVGVEKSCSIC